MTPTKWSLATDAQVVPSSWRTTGVSKARRATAGLRRIRWEPVRLRLDMRTAVPAALRPNPLQPKRRRPVTSFERAQDPATQPSRCCEATGWFGGAARPRGTGAGWADDF